MKKDRSRAKRGRNDETREKKDELSTSKITFSFANFLGSDTKGTGQSWEDWNDKDPQRIVDLLNKLKYLGTINSTQAKEEKSLAVYGPFPKDSKFVCPENLKEKNNWGVIRKLGSGWKLRVPGYYEGQGVFHIVFLDDEHEFWPSES
jgi:hypothetical protein